MENEKKCHASVRRQAPEELRHCLQATGRRANTYDEEVSAGSRRLRGGIASRGTRDRPPRGVLLRFPRPLRAQNPSQRNPTPEAREYRPCGRQHNRLFRRRALAGRTTEEIFSNRAATVAYD